eukprot:5270485-Pyramimonas_sp.AAC.1
MQYVQQRAQFLRVHKVKAHLDPEAEGIAADEKWRRQGNAAADRAAKAGAAMRPTWSALDEEVLQFHLKVSKQVCNLAAALLPLWPRPSLSEVGLVLPPRRERPEAPPPSWA